MADFSVTEAAYTGFRVVRERPLAVAIWAGIQFLVAAGFGFYLTETCGPVVTKLIAMQSGAAAPPDPTQILPLLMGLGPFYAGAAVLSLTFYPILFAAMNRAVLRPTQSAVGYLRLGAAEAWQSLLIMIAFVVLMAAYLAAVVVAAIIANVAGVAAALAVSIVAAVCGLAYFGVRFSLAPALTFATGRLNLLGSWRMTRGRFWPLLGAYLLALALAALVSSLVFALTAAASAVVGGDVASLDALMHANMTTPAAYFTPARLVYLALSSVSWALVWPVVFTPAATIYARLAASYGFPASGRPAQSDVFA